MELILIENIDFLAVLTMGLHTDRDRYAPLFFVENVVTIDLYGNEKIYQSQDRYMPSLMENVGIIDLYGNEKIDQF